MYVFGALNNNNTVIFNKTTFNIFITTSPDFLKFIEQKMKQEEWKRIKKMLIIEILISIMKNFYETSIKSPYCHTYFKRTEEESVKMQNLFFRNYNIFIVQISKKNLVCMKIPRSFPSEYKNFWLLNLEIFRLRSRNLHTDEKKYP